MHKLATFSSHIWHTYFFRWLDRRVPGAVRHRLHRRNLYVFPNWVGLGFLALALLIWLLGTNYQNNLILALAYFQLSLFVVVILQTYNNMAGIEIKVLGSRSGFAGDAIEFLLELKTPSRRGADNLKLRWQHGEARLLALEPDTPCQLTLSATAHRRGYFKPGRLLLESSYPMGIIRCWSWLNVDTTAIIFPAPVVCDMPVHSAGKEHDDGQHWVRGGEEYSGLKQYQPGDAIKHVAWKHYAREKGLLTKEFGQAMWEDLWLDLEQFNAYDLETALSCMCHLALELDRDNRGFGLRLPGLEIPEGTGEEHKLKVLQALATYGL